MTTEQRSEKKLSRWQKVTLAIAIPMITALAGGGCTSNSNEGGSRPVPSITGAKAEGGILSGDPLVDTGNSGHPLSEELQRNRIDASTNVADIAKEDRPIPDIRRAKGF